MQLACPIIESKSGPNALGGAIGALNAKWPKMVFSNGPSRLQLTLAGTCGILWASKPGFGPDNKDNPMFPLHQGEGPCASERIQVMIRVAGEQGPPGCLVAALRGVRGPLPFQCASGCWPSQVSGGNPAAPWSVLLPWRAGGSIP